MWWNSITFLFNLLMRSDFETFTQVPLFKEFPWESPDKKFKLRGATRMFIYTFYTNISQLLVLHISNWKGYFGYKNFTPTISKSFQKIIDFLSLPCSLPPFLLQNSFLGILSSRDFSIYLDKAKLNSLLVYSDLMLYLLINYPVLSTPSVNSWCII